jgi:hypothetical protein
MRRSSFYIPPGELPALADALLNVVDPRLAPLWAAGLLAAWVPRRDRPEGRWAAVVVALAVANVALYWVIPYRTQQRFLLPAVGLATAPLACLLDRARWLRWTAVGLLALHLVTPATWPVTPFGQRTEWGFTGSLLSAAQGPVPAIPTPSQWRAMQGWLDLGLVVGIPLASGLLALLAARDGMSMRRDRTPGRGLRATIATAAMLALPCAWAWYQVVESGSTFPSTALARAWDRLDRLAGPRRARIAYAGTNLVYYLMGRGQRHDVVYVNIDAHRGWRLHDYHREAIARGEPNWPDPRPGWDRLHPDYGAWLANLAAERIDFLFVARPDRTDGRFNIADRQGYPIERLWADAHPEAFTLVYGPADGEPIARISRVHPPPRGGYSYGGPRPPRTTIRSAWESGSRTGCAASKSAGSTSGGLFVSSGRNTFPQGPFDLGMVRRRDPSPATPPDSYRRARRDRREDAENSGEGATRRPIAESLLLFSAFASAVSAVSAVRSV